MKSIEERTKIFKLKCSKYLEIYSENMIEDFTDYWCEYNEGGKKMRFEKQKTFNKKMRLARWYKNTQKWNNKKTNNNFFTPVEKFKLENGIL